MQLFHTSPEKITQIKKTGTFGEFLFFSSSIYHTTAGDAVTYKTDVDDADIIDAGSLFYHPDAAALDCLVNQFCKRFDVNADTAEEIISERAQLTDDGREFDADESWDCQHFTARAAKILGFRGVAVRDEHGTSYMIDMLGREGELVEVK